VSGDPVEWRGMRGGECIRMGRVFERDLELRLIF